MINPGAGTFMFRLYQFTKGYSKWNQLILKSTENQTNFGIRPICPSLYLLNSFGWWRLKNKRNMLTMISRILIPLDM